MVLDLGKFPEMNTFSSVIRFSLCLEEAAEGFYHQAMDLWPEQAAGLAELAGLHQKRYVLLEETRQQKLNEMILEPVSGCERADYLPDVALDNAQDIVPKALALENLSAKFYDNLSQVSRELSREAAKVYARLARENEKLQAKVQALG